MAKLSNRQLDIRKAYDDEFKRYGYALKFIEAKDKTLADYKWLISISPSEIFSDGTFIKDKVFITGI